MKKSVAMSKSERYREEMVNNSSSELRRVRQQTEMDIVLQEARIEELSTQLRKARAAQKEHALLLKVINTILGDRK